MFTEDEKRKNYNEEWYSFFENYHDLDLENKVNSDAISIYIYANSLYERSALDFEHSYSDRDLESQYSCRKSLKYLFENGFSWINIKEQSKYYQLLIDLKSSICRSPYKNFENKKDFFILRSPDNKIYCILGVAFLPRKINKTFFGYLGELNKVTNKQTTIFDFIDEGK